ncbi:MAG: FAD binding domain-containing protein [Acidimicrobiaceae bacterium]|nr:FAD binding domain-containing protein [Acidimicrobiaceae bacterium]
MPLVTAYHRPASLQEALDLLSSPQRVALGGGTMLNADRRPSDLEAVDLQALGLDSITALDGGLVRLGATATLDDMRRCELLPDSLRDLARLEQPSTLRTLASVGGLVAKASAESVLLAGLLAHDGRVELAGPASELSLAGLLAAGLPPGSLITAVTVDPSGRTATARTGRTPADVPIVAAYGRRIEGFVAMALTGVGDHPVLVDVFDPTAGLEPAADFRGSPEYRLYLARTLTARVMAELG